MIGAIYGLQALVFIFRRKWDMIGWMLFYILAIPAFSFLLPLYSFWKMDDFSWGSTRIVLGDSGKKIVIHVSSIATAWTARSNGSHFTGRRKIRSQSHSAQNMERIREFFENSTLYL